MSSDLSEAVGLRDESQRNHSVSQCHSVGDTLYEARYRNAAAATVLQRWMDLKHYDDQYQQYRSCRAAGAGATGALITLSPWDEDAVVSLFPWFEQMLLKMLRPFSQLWNWCLSCVCSALSAVTYCFCHRLSTYHEVIITISSVQFALTEDGRTCAAVETREQAAPQMAVIRLDKDFQSP